MTLGFVVCCSTALPLGTSGQTCLPDLASSRVFSRYMGRAGLEPATLGLKVLPNKLRRAAANWKCLQTVRLDAATSCNESQPVETSLYAHPYTHLSPPEATSSTHQRVHLSHGHADRDRVPRARLAEQGRLHQHRRPPAGSRDLRHVSRGVTSPGELRKVAIVTGASQG